VIQFFVFYSLPVTLCPKLFIISANIYPSILLLHFILYGIIIIIIIIIMLGMDGTC
jgi:hypothetical protein